MLMRSLSFAFAAGLLAASSTPAFAQDEPIEAAAPQPTLPSVVGLTPEQRSAALEAAARDSNDLPINGLSRGIHGEMGFEIGSRGERAAYGSAAIPLGSNATAAFSFMTGQSGRYRW